jgi:hypothetical protein
METIMPVPKLNDTQLILLSVAAQRENHSIYPLPQALAPGTGVTKAIKALVDKALAEERESSDTAAIHRTDGDIRYGLFATAAGFAAIGVGDEAGEGEAVAPAAKPERQTKANAVIALLEREEGATLAELIAATDWLPHTTRAALTGLRKKGHVIGRSKRGEETCYRIVKAA